SPAFEIELEALATSLGEISTPTALTLYFSTAAIRIRPSPHPKSYSVSPGLMLAISSMRSTTWLGEATYGASLFEYRGLGVCAIAGRVASVRIKLAGKRMSVH